MKTVLCYVLSLIGILNLFGQTFKGKLIDEQGNAIVGANLILLSLPDMTLIKGAISDIKGEFSLTNPTNKQQIALKITHLEYQTKQITPNQLDLGVIILYKSVNSIDEVVISASRPIIKQVGTQIKTDIAHTNLIKLPKMDMLLSFLPGVSRSFRNGIEVFGKGNIVFYVGKKRIPQGEIFLELERLSPQDIESITIETQPGAEFDNKVGAVIYIQLKKKQGEGLSGILGNQANLYKGVGLFVFSELTYRKNKTDISWLLFTPMYFSEMNNRTQNDFKVHFKDQQWEIKSMSQSQKNTKGIVNRLQFGHEFNERHTMGMAAVAELIPILGKDYQNETSQIWNKNILQNNNKAHYKHFTPNNNYKWSAYYEGKFENDFKLQSDILYERWASNHKTEILEENLLTKQQQNLQTHNKAQIDAVELKTTLSQKIAKGSISYGVEGKVLVRNENYDDSKGNISPEIQQNEKYLAGFASMSYPIRKIGIKTGLRYEYNGFDYFENHKKNNNKSPIYANWLPSVSISFPWNKTSWSLNYIKKIKRPELYELGDFITYKTSFLYSKGNPLLKPTLEDEFSWLVSYKNFSLSAEYKIIKSAVGEHYDIFNINNTSVLLRNSINHNPFQEFTISVSAKHKYKLWNMSLNAGISKQFAKNVFFNNDPLIFASAQNQFLFSPRWSSMLFLDFRSSGAEKEIYYSKDIFDVSLMFVYTIEKYNTQFYGGVSKIFNSSSNDKKIIGHHVINTIGDIEKNNRYISIAVVYKFNPIQKRFKKEAFPMNLN